MKTKKAQIMEIGDKLFEIIDGEKIKDGETVTISFQFGADGLEDFYGEKTVTEEINLNLWEE